MAPFQANAPPPQFAPHVGAAWQQQGAPLMQMPMQMPMGMPMPMPMPPMVGGLPMPPMAGGLPMPPHHGMYQQQQPQQAMYAPPHLYGAPPPPQGYYQQGMPQQMQQQGYYPQQMAPMPMGMPMGGMGGYPTGGYGGPGYGAYPPSAAVQTFLAAPPPPGKPPGWIPPPLHTVVPGFPMPGQGAPMPPSGPAQQ